MTRIDFYVLQQNTELDRLRFAARLCEKAVTQGMSVLILTHSQAISIQMSETLWGHKPESFIPHSIIGGNPSPEEKVLITSGEDDMTHHGLLINLGFEVPEMFSRFERVAEIVVQTESTLQATRKHFSYYRERGYPVESHKLSNA